MINGISIAPQTFNKNTSFCVGFADSQLNQNCMSLRIRNAITTQGVAWREQFNDSCFVEVTETGPTLKVALASIIDGGFRLNYITTNGFSDGIPFVAIAGPRVKVGDFASPTAPSIQKVVQPFRPEVVMLATGGLDSFGGLTTNARIALGLMTTDEQATLWAGQKQITTGTHLAKSSQDATKALQFFTEGTTSTEEIAATRDSFLTDGFQLNWTNIDVLSWQHQYIAIGSAPTGTRALLDANATTAFIENANLAAPARLTGGDSVQFFEAAALSATIWAYDGSVSTQTDVPSDYVQIVTTLSELQAVATLQSDFSRSFASSTRVSTLSPSVESPSAFVNFTEPIPEDETGPTFNAKTRQIQQKARARSRVRRYEPEINIELPVVGITAEVHVYTGEAKEIPSIASPSEFVSHPVTLQVFEYEGAVESIKLEFVAAENFRPAPVLLACEAQSSIDFHVGISSECEFRVATHVFEALEVVSAPRMLLQSEVEVTHCFQHEGTFTCRHAIAADIEYKDFLQYLLKQDDEFLLEWLV
jgi:hypothetical protein